MTRTSVVIPLYNKAPHIKRAIQSALSQTVLPAEVIVIDDGSTDGGGDIVQNLANTLIKLIRQENRGDGGARNRGIAAATGDLIAFLDADDAWEPRFLETILRLAKKYPQAGAFATAYKVIAPDGSEQIPEFNVLPLGNGDGIIENYFRVGLYFPVWVSATAVPKKVLQEIDGFSIGDVCAVDVDTWLRIALRYPLAWSSQYLAIYYQDATNRICGFTRWNKEPKVSRSARDALNSGLVPKEQVQDLKEYAAHFQLAAARDCLALGNKGTALQLLGYARGTKKFARKWWQWRLIAALPGNQGPWLWKLKQGWNRLIG